MRLPRAARLLTTLATGVALHPAAAPPLSAQDSPRRDLPGVIPGSTVRVRGRGLAVDAKPATVVARRGDTLVLRPRGGTLAFVPFARVARVEVSASVRARSRSSWAPAAR